MPGGHTLAAATVARGKQVVAVAHTVAREAAAWAAKPAQGATAAPESVSGPDAHHRTTVARAAGAAAAVAEPASAAVRMEPAAAAAETGTAAQAVARASGAGTAAASTRSK
jgi:hypothetical protein